MQAIQLEFDFKEKREWPPYQPTPCYFQRKGFPCPMVVGKPGQTIFITCNKCKYH